MRSLLTRRLAFLCAAAFVGYATVAGVGYMVSFYARDEMGLGPLERGARAGLLRLLRLPARAAAGRRRAEDRAGSGGRDRCADVGGLRRAARLQHGALAARALWTLAGAGSVLLWTGLNTLALESVPENRGGATSVFGAFRFAGSALSPYVFLPLYNTDPSRRIRGLCRSPPCVIVPLAIAIRTLSAEPVPRPATVSCRPMSDCIFCGIAAGTMPAERVHADERTVAFLDIFPACDGHVLVIPRAHADDVHAADPADVAACAQTAQLMAGRSAARSAATASRSRRPTAAPPGRPSSTTTCT